MPERLPARELPCAFYDDDLVEWRGKVDHVATGEGYYFRDWSRLIVCLDKMLRPGFRTGVGVG